MDPIYIPPWLDSVFCSVGSYEELMREQEGGKEKRKKHLVERGIKIGPVQKERQDEIFKDKCSPWIGDTAWLEVTTFCILNFRCSKLVHVTYLLLKLGDLELRTLLFFTSFFLRLQNLPCGAHHVYFYYVV